MAGNALMERLQEAPTGPANGPTPDGGDSPEAQMEKLMQETGYKGNDPAEGMAHVWKAMPTDDIAELIDKLAQKHGLPTPFPKEGGKMKLDGPNDGDQGGAMELGARNARNPSDAFARLYAHTNEPPESHGEVPGGQLFGPYDQRDGINDGIIKPMERYQGIRNRLMQRRSPR